VVGKGTGGISSGQEKTGQNMVTAELEPNQVQDLGDIIPALLEFKTKYDADVKFTVSLQLKGSKEKISQDVMKQLNELLAGVDKGLKFEV